LQSTNFRQIAPPRTDAEKALAPAGGLVRLRFETIFLALVWIAVILLIVLYPHWEL